MIYLSLIRVMFWIQGGGGQMPTFNFEKSTGEFYKNRALIET